MLYTPTLSQINRDSLANVVILQVELLRYAASREGVNFIATGKEKKGEETNHMVSAFAAHLNNLSQDPRFRGHEDEIAQWCWNGPQGQKGRKRQKHLKYLECFAKLQPEEQEKKYQWCERINQEVRDLLDEEKQIIPIGNFLEGPLAMHFNEKNNEILTWQGAAYRFFLYFYNDFLGNSADSSTFPRELSGNDKPFGRQTFLQEFIHCNQELIICPICDTNRYYVQTSNHIYGTIDHFLPKSLYPHFACHPYNLIPICHGCNSWFKGTLNPLKDEQRIIRSILPYTPRNGDRFYLQVTLKSNDTSIGVGQLCSLTTGDEQIRLETKRLIDILKDLYRIPERWKADTIGETLFRRMRQFLDNGRVIPDGKNLPFEIYNSLEHLLYYLDQEDRQKDPLSFALAWTLVAFIKEQVLPYLQEVESAATIDTNGSYLLEEIERWFNNDIKKEIKQRSERVRELLSTPTTAVDLKIGNTDSTPKSLKY